MIFIVVWFAFPWWLVMLNVFSCACRPAVCLLWGNVYSGSLPIFKIKLFDVLILSCRSFLYILNISTLSIRHIICKCLLTFRRLPFCFVDGFLHDTQVFLSSFLILAVVPFVCFCSCFPCLWSQIHKTVTNTDLKRAFCLCFFLRVVWFQILNSSV